MRLHQTIKKRTRRTRPPLTEYQKIEVLEDHRAPEFTIKKEQGKKKRCHIIRQEGHETLPRFVGKWFSRSDNEAEREFFMGSMMMLLKPWRNLHEIKAVTESFENAYETFMNQADEKSKRVVANVQYYYECSDAAKEDRLKGQTFGDKNPAGQDGIEVGNLDIHENEGDFEEGRQNILQEITDDDIERALLMRIHPRERLYGESAVALGYEIGFFKDDDMDVTVEKKVRKAFAEEHEQIRFWETQLKAITREQFATTGTIRVSDDGDEPGSSVLLAGPGVEIRPHLQNLGDRTVLNNQSERETDRPLLTILNEEQRRAHNIIEERLREHITCE